MQQNTALIRLDAIRENARTFSALVKGSKLCAVVKADAYGHGAAMVAQALSVQADMFAVALVEEGMQLRCAGIAKDILVLVPALSESEVRRAIYYDLILSVGDARDYALIARVSQKTGGCVRCHLKVNTGMNRFGFDYDGFSSFTSGRLTDRIAVEGIYSHFYRPENETVTHRQYFLFCNFCKEAERVFGKLTKHIAATGGTLADKEYHLDMVRIGIGLYGYLPGGFTKKDLALQRAMSVFASVAAEREYHGGGAGYGDYVPKGERLCVVRAGYADGLFRKGVGTNDLCMDVFVAEANREKYQSVCILSDAEAYAKKYGTIAYEVLCKAGMRAVREYVDG